MTRSTAVPNARTASAAGWLRKEYSVLPGFGLSLGITLLYLALIVLLPLSSLILRSCTLGADAFFSMVTAPRALASYRLSFSASFIAALINAVCGFGVAWVLARYEFPGKKIMDAFVDIPFALPTAVAGIALTTLYAPSGLIGSRLNAAGIQAAYSPLGVVIALTFISLPFAVRTLQPVIQDLDLEIEEAAKSLGANRWQTFSRVLLPGCLPALLTGFTLCFARALGEYGSIVFISGNMPFKTEITPFLIVTKLEQYDYAGATTVASVILAASFALLLLTNGLHGWTRKIYGHFAS